MRKHGNDEVFRITGARQGLADDVRGRQRRYVISMSVRTVAVILAAVLWNVERHVAIVALVLGILLPYISVVIANAGRENAPSLPSTFVPAPVRPMLTAPSHPDAAEEAGPTEAGPTEAGPTEAGPTEAGQTEAGPTEAAEGDGAGREQARGQR
ncbi:DUF3099 domain-containing protein [Streptomyces sp. B-S-A8]|uniref:DUF3099 domain-containing protein n=1 Tax=Streptomyces solicavernae TaxID=3043614 RepID=A0ABT6RSU7_9ACTN|nr:DUF3099 domain-containing protein [Streptomyces sp. B-S-A8]MDI3387472.1 DUF3099 domain-containing protein [Streptomyces sp. B-S-A8]